MGNLLVDDEEQPNMLNQLFFKKAYSDLEIDYCARRT